MTPFWWLGSAGFLAIEASYVPQIARLFRLKRADEVSYFFPALNLIGRVLALVYSMSEHNTVFVSGFVLGISLRVVLLAQVFWYRRSHAPHHALVAT
ncbi:MAG TPA: PQ-loop repeat-containing protein [Polyangiaceae bacterium]|jgi:lipid-A-disaccharide synthase-like uncharacterized protein